jgi:hypothetical protein
VNDQAGLLADPLEVRAILIASATAGEPITYSETLQLLGHHFTRPKMRALCKVLAFVDDEAEERGEPELAVLVVRQSDGLPGQGWWVGGEPAAADDVADHGGGDGRRHEAVDQNPQNRDRKESHDDLDDPAQDPSQ